jgi:hypothetical protein
MPLAGILSYGLFGAEFYSVAQFSFATSSLAAVACGLMLTVAGSYLSRYRPENLAACAGLVALNSIAIVLVTYSTSRVCSPAIFAADGSDQMNLRTRVRLDTPAFYA